MSDLALRLKVEDLINEILLRADCDVQHDHKLDDLVLYIPPSVIEQLATSIIELVRIEGRKELRRNDNVGR